MSDIFPLTVNNQSNEEIVIRYMKQGAPGIEEHRIGARGKKILTNAYLGMSLYASNMFDPSEAYASVTVKDYIDDVHFTESAGGVGVGNPALNIAKREEQPQACKKKKGARKSPFDRRADSRSDQRGASLADAHRENLLGEKDDSADPFRDVGESSAKTQPDDAAAAEEKAEQIWVAGLGYVNKSTLPPHVLKQLEDRERLQKSQNLPPDSGMPQMVNYDDQKKQMELDGVNLKPLPPLRKKNSHVVKVKSQNLYLCAVKKWIQRTAMSLFRLRLSDSNAMTVIYSFLALILFACYYGYRNYYLPSKQKQKVQAHRQLLRARR